MLRVFETLQMEPLSVSWGWPGIAEADILADVGALRPEGIEGPCRVSALLLDLGGHQGACNPLADGYPGAKCQTWSQLMLDPSHALMEFVPAPDVLGLRQAANAQLQTRTTIAFRTFRTFRTCNPFFEKGKNEERRPDQDHGRV